MSTTKKSFTAREFLLDMRELFTTHNRWIKGHYRTKQGEKEYFCAVGAINRAYRNADTQSRKEITQVKRQMMYECVTKYNVDPYQDHAIEKVNDKHGKKAIISMIDHLLKKFYPPTKEEVCQLEPVKAVKEKVVRSSSKSSKTSGKQLEDLFPGTNTPDPTMEPEPLPSS